MLTALVLPVLGITLWSQPAAADHHLTVDAPVARWETVVAYRAAHPVDTLLFQAPLPRGAVLEPQDGVTPILNREGRVTGVEIQWTITNVTSDRRHADVFVTLRVRTPMEEGALNPPLVEGPAVQRVVVEGGWMFEPAQQDGLEHHVGYWVPRSLDREDRRQVDRLLPDRHVPPGTLRVYMQQGPMAGRWTSPQQHRARGAWLVAGAFPVTVAGLWLAWKKLSRRVDEQRADAIIRSAFDDLNT